MEPDGAPCKKLKPYDASTCCETPIMFSDISYAWINAKKVLWRPNDRDSVKTAMEIRLSH